jgi:anti-sigma regulatory factor (Ser/Thr protein kinase)
VTPDPATLHLELPRATGSVPVARAAVTRWLEDVPAATTEDDRAALRLAVTETFANAVEHGGDGPVTLTVTCRRGSVVAVVRDGGRWPAADRERPAGVTPVTAERGRGLGLLGAVVDEVQVVETRVGTAAAFVRHLGVPARATVPPSDR